MPHPPHSEDTRRHKFLLQLSPRKLCWRMTCTPEVVVIIFIVETWCCFCFCLLSCLSVQLPQAHSYPTNLPKFIRKLNWTCDNPGAVWKKRKTSKKSRRMFYLCCVFTNGTVITVDYRGFLPQTLSWEDSSKYWWVLYGVASMLLFCHFYCWVLCGAYAKP